MKNRAPNLFCVQQSNQGARTALGSRRFSGTGIGGPPCVRLPSCVLFMDASAPRSSWIDWVGPFTDRWRAVVACQISESISDHPDAHSPPHVTSQSQTRKRRADTAAAPSTHNPHKGPHPTHEQRQRLRCAAIAADCDRSTGRLRLSLRSSSASKRSSLGHTHRPPPRHHRSAYILSSPSSSMSRQLTALAGRLAVTSAPTAAPSSRSPASLVARLLSNSVHQVVSQLLASSLA